MSQSDSHPDPRAARTAAPKTARYGLLGQNRLRVETVANGFAVFNDLWHGDVQLWGEVHVFNSHDDLAEWVEKWGRLAPDRRDGALRTEPPC
jgi:hypothetical protein